MERKARKEKRRQEEIFFKDVQRNIISSLARGELIPGVAREDKKVVEQGPPQEPVTKVVSLLRVRQPSQKRLQMEQHSQQASRIRTISGMNEQLLAELQSGDKPNRPDATGDAAAAANRSSAGQRPASTAAATSTTAQPAAAPATVEGRPPLMPPRGSSSKAVIETKESSSQDSMDLSPDDVQPKTAGAAAPTAAGATVSAADHPAESLRGESLLDGPILESASGRVSIATASGNPTGDSADAPAAAAADQAPASSSSAANPSHQQLSHVRRNTGGTIFSLHSTMENPDINATIRCVCGVYRAHIVQAAERKTQRSPVSVLAPQMPPQHFNNVNLGIFRDDYDELLHSHTYDMPAAPPATATADDVPVPTLLEIETFYHDFFRRSQMEQDTIIMSLIYVERLIKETNGALAPAPHNWRSILFSCMVLSSKVWDDLSMFNLDFSNVSMASGLSSFSLQRTNQLELAVLQCLNFCVRVPASEYAKYYFLIRTMLLRSGMLEDVPLRKDCHSLETRTRQYQDSKLGSVNERRARSVDWSNVFGGQEMEPVLGERCCLEQLVSMDRR